MTILSYDEYVGSLSQLSNPFDPTVPTAESEKIRAMTSALAGLPVIDRDSLLTFIRDDPDAVPVLGLAVGLTQEKLKNVLRHYLGSSGWVTLARQRPVEVIEVLDEHYDLIRLIEEQRTRIYEFGDILVARAGSRQTATATGATGRRVEDEIEKLAGDLALPYATRTRFEGRNGQSAPCDLAIPAGGRDAQIVVAAKGFHSTGSKLSDAVREIDEMAHTRLPSQYVMAAIDGIGWKSRASDLRRIYELRATNQIDGLYTLQGLGQFRTDLENAARRLSLI
ncbi:MAG: hypothetical protein M3Q03_03765 [Chloroflexota bacterium]|nr:hypothetical protein [Chloroflexota bacterium]